MMRARNNRNRTAQLHRRGFTLVELLVVITIVLIIMSMTVAAVSFSREKDRVSKEAGRIQSFFAGARDRAIYEDEMRGVRLFIEPPPPGSATGAESRTVSSMAYIAPGGTWAAPEHSSNIDLLRADRGDGAGGAPDGDFDDAEDLLIRVRGSNNPGWWNLKRRGWLVDGLRMRIPAGPTGHWYNISTGLIDTTQPPTDVQFLLLQIPYADGGNEGQEVAWSDLTYEIELPARILPKEPLLLASGVVIDLDGSDIPSIWRPASTGNGQYSGYMDIWFSPRGNVLGDAAAKGVLHFYVCDSEDTLFLKEQFVAALPDRNASGSSVDEFDGGIANGIPFMPVDEVNLGPGGWLAWDGAYLAKDRRLVTLFGTTGGITVNKVNAYIGIGGGVADRFDPFDYDDDGVTNEPDGLADDPYRFAETGEESK